MAYLLGLTGSIGMGKSTTAAMFASAGADVWDADAAVHRLYAPGGLGVDAVGALCPEAVGDHGVDRARLKAWILEDKTNLARLEAAIHPLVAADRDAFRDAFRAAATADVAVFDIPLLYETGAEAWLDGVVVVSVDAATERARVLARPGMTEAQFAAILARQMPDAEKRRRADWVVITRTLEGARRQVHSILRQIRTGGDARDRT